MGADRGIGHSPVVGRSRAGRRRAGPLGAAGEGAALAPVGVSASDCITGRRVIIPSVDGTAPNGVSQSCEGGARSGETVVRPADGAEPSRRPSRPSRTDGVLIPCTRQRH